MFGNPASQRPPFRKEFHILSNMPIRLTVSESKDTCRAISYFSFRLKITNHYQSQHESLTYGKGHFQVSQCGRFNVLL